MSIKGNALSYRRVSTNKQVLEGEGLDIQLSRIEEFCSMNGLIVVKDFSDEGVSGAKDTVDRLGMMELLNYCRNNNHIEYIVIDKVDRLSRDFYQQLFVEKELKKCDVTILFAAQEVLNEDNSMSEMEKAYKDAMRQMMGVFAELERKMINQRLSDGTRKKATNGNKPVGRQPFGYEYTRDGKLTVINESEAEIVRRMFELRIMGKSLDAIAYNINRITTDERREKYAKNNRNRKWTRQSVRFVLANDYYCGIVTYGKNKTKGNHEPIISIEEWNMVNNKV